MYIYILTIYLITKLNLKHIIIIVKGVIKLKKERNCGGFPVYPNMGNMAMPFPMCQNMTPNMPMYDININAELANINNKINNLEQRITSLENSLNKNYSNNYSNSYNTSNYQMM